MKHTLIVTLIIFLIISCKQQTHQQEIKEINYEAIQRLPELEQVDSVDIHFFKDIKDLKIYSRNSTTDTAFLKLLLNTINGKSLGSVPCEFDTKLFCFAKGNFIKTLYVATNDTCNFIGYVSSGAVSTKVELNKQMAETIKQLKLKSVKN